MSRHVQISAFVEALTAHDGFAPFSDAKLPSLDSAESSVLITERDAVVGIGAVANHAQTGGSVHSSFETAVRPDMRFSEFEGALLDATFSLGHEPGSYSVWSHRVTLNKALEDRGFEAIRVLDLLTVELPITQEHVRKDPATSIETFEPSDTRAIVAVNNAAFKDHREAGSLSADEMKRYAKAEWFDQDGLFVAHIGGPIGFCWTRVHSNGDGEIYRIAVDPRHHGRGIGFDLLLAGFQYLGRRRDVRRGVLWFDRSNETARDLYRSIGMETLRSNTEFGPVRSRV